MRELFQAYGSLLLLQGWLAPLLLFLATMVEPRAGVCALVAGIGVLATRRLLPLAQAPRQSELVNALLVGHLLGSTYLPGRGCAVLLAAAGPLTVIVTVALQARVRPVLCAPFVLVSYLLLGAGHALLLPLAPPPELLALPYLPWVQGWLRALGGVYLVPNIVSGALVALALVAASPTLWLLSVLAFACSSLLLIVAGVPAHSWSLVFAGTQAILSSLMVGGLWLAPSRASLLLGLLAGAGSSLLYLCLIPWNAALPPLALPFLLSTWAALSLCRSQHGWRFSRLLQPALPEQSGERAVQARARGLDCESVALRAPFQGPWQVYQSFDGPYTHRGPWAHALDFYRCHGQRSFRGSGNEVTDYLCFGADVLAPVAGTVWSCEANLADNEPGEVDVSQRWGNYVLLRSHDGYYVLLAHLQQNSVVVRPGQSVQLGEPLARCGNSGRSPQPHLHLHVQLTPELGSPTVPFHLSNVQCDELYSLHCRPQQGATVTPFRASPRVAEALHLPVGRRLVFRVDGEQRKLEVELDLQGQFWLRSDRGARVAFLETTELLACYDRNEVPDPFLDAFTLALGLSPLGEAERWGDRPPVRLAGAAWRLPWQRNLEMQYSRRWEGGAWHQQGHCPGLSCWAKFRADAGVVSFGMRRGGGTLQAELDAVGLRGDDGIPAWQAPVALPA